MIYKNYLKRLFDLLFSLLLIFLLWPLFLLIYLIILIFDGRPVLYKQLRTGKDGKDFFVYKYRTMNNVSKEKEILIPHEKRVTKIGKFLRKTSLDELPQLFNVLKGEMSIIGPRPWIVEYYQNFNKQQKRRVEVKPGIIGLAQVMGRNGLDVFTKIKYDLEYIDNLSLFLDLKIFFLSIIIVFKKSHAEIIQEDMLKEIDTLKLQHYE